MRRAYSSLRKGSVSLESPPSHSSPTSTSPIGRKNQVYTDLATLDPSIGILKNTWSLFGDLSDLDLAIVDSVLDSRKTNKSVEPLKALTTPPPVTDFSTADNAAPLSVSPPQEINLSLQSSLPLQPVNPRDPIPNTVLPDSHSPLPSSLHPSDRSDPPPLFTDEDFPPLVTTGPNPKSP